MNIQIKKSVAGPLHSIPFFGVNIIFTVDMSTVEPRGENTPTIRSKFSFKQFEEALQKLAHKAAIEAVTNLDRGITIKTFHSARVPSQLSEVSANKETFRFYLRHASYAFGDSGSWDDYFGFDVEEKFYLSSNHCTKISYYTGDEPKAAAKRTKKVTKFIDELMEGVEVVPRFTLKKFAEQP